MPIKLEAFTVTTWYSLQALCIICQKHTRENVGCFLNAPGDGDKSRVCASKCDGQLHEFRTFGTDENKREMATDLQDTGLLAKISDGALTVTEAKHCLAKLHLEIGIILSSDKIKPACV